MNTPVLKKDAAGEAATDIPFTSSLNRRPLASTAVPALAPELSRPKSVQETAVPATTVADGQLKREVEAFSAAGCTTEEAVPRETPPMVTSTLCTPNDAGQMRVVKVSPSPASSTTLPVVTTPALLLEVAVNTTVPDRPGIV